MKRTVLAAALLIMGIMQAKAYATCADHNFTYIVRCQRDEIEGEQNVNWAGYHKCIVFEKYWSWHPDTCGGWEYVYCGKSGESMQGNFVAGSPACEDRCENVGNASFELIKEICIGPGDDIADPLAGGIDWYCPGSCEDKDGDGHYPLSSTCCPADDCNDDPDKDGYYIKPGVTEVCDDDKDNDCDGQTDGEDDDCELELKYISGSGQKDYICKTLGEPLVVSVEGGTDMGRVDVTWTITNSPSGSNASFSGNVVVEEADRVLHKEYLDLGDTSGEFTIEAGCPECPEGSPQTFTAEAECPKVPTYSQTAYPNDPYDKWCKTVDSEGNKTGKATCKYDDDGIPRDGYIEFSIKEMGCALTSLAMVMGRYGSEATPDVWNAFMTESGGYKNGDVDWDAPMKIDAQLEKALSKRSANDDTPLSNSLMDTYFAKCMPVIVKVDNSGGTHWVVVTGKSGNSYSINDPGYSSRTDLSAYGNKIYGIEVYKDAGECQ